MALVPVNYVNPSAWSTLCAVEDTGHHQQQLGPQTEAVNDCTWS